jgi:hypothetical protein
LWKLVSEHLNAFSSPILHFTSQSIIHTCRQRAHWLVCMLPIWHHICSLHVFAEFGRLADTWWWWYITHEENNNIAACWKP